MKKAGAMSPTWREPSTPARRIGATYSQNRGRGMRRRRLPSDRPCNRYEPSVPASSTFRGLRPVIPSIACGNTSLLEIGINRMSSTTPRRKSSRMNAQPISATHRYSAFSPATAMTDPQRAPRSAMPVKTESLNATRRDERASRGESSLKPAVHHRPRAADPGEVRRSRTRAIGQPGSKCVEYGADDTSAGIAQLADDAGRIGKTGVIFASKHHYAASPEGQTLRIGVELRRRRIEEDDVELGP